MVKEVYSRGESMACSHLATYQGPPAEVRCPPQPTYTATDSGPCFSMIALSLAPTSSMACELSISVN